ncbi:MAG TPA: ferredoxin [Desulfovibrio sp.]|mgnify:CR=1 FL=1|jgi:ferredoxin|uniref:ferredoxin n=1 Tax=Desulfovibrio TaxID=872 RepID=UPI0004254AF6|nr:MULTISPECIES: ferredoxin [Desulfovibrio]MCM0754581.1 ferredoxin [Desulfovibrio aminophilus]MDY0304813.1 ferredoxin [Desulfovibrionaceae bacterium]HMM39480.1 ferredoxin [Desulfovibrio sp.]
MAKVVYIDQDECIGCESCVGICPDVFAMDDSAGKARVVNPDGAPEEQIQEAIDTCPAQCIHWE